ncbi:MAG: LysM peptidoglycan-binding domain-containing protein, partial [Acidimicrobiales bacterium]|nr:LysM peptidoglycan-binding domain-containing protein [Acidimicrobiales bacterium]
RRRLVAALVLATTVFSATLVADELAGRATGTPGGVPAGAASEPVVYVVQPGDTLWAIAERFSPEGIDVRHTVDRLSDAAGGALLQPGQRIVLPLGG